MPHLVMCFRKNKEDQNWKVFFEFSSKAVLRGLGISVQWWRGVEYLCGQRYSWDGQPFENLDCNKNEKEKSHSVELFQIEEIWTR